MNRIGKLTAICGVVLVSFAPLAAGAQDDDQSMERDLTVVQRPIYNLHPEHHGALDVNAWTDRRSYRPGDKVHLKVRASRGAYITVIDVGTSGRTTVLFPNRRAHDNWVDAGKELRLPDSDDNWAIQVGGPSGIEVIKVFASTSQRPIYNITDLTNGDVFTVFRHEGGDASRDLSVVLDHDHRGQWAETVNLVRIHGGD